MIQKANSAEVNTLLSTGRQIRYGVGTRGLKPAPKLRGIVLQGIAKVANRHVKFTKAIWPILAQAWGEGWPSLETVRRDANQKDYLPELDYTVKACCGDHRPLKLKGFTIDEIARVNGQFASQWPVESFLLDKEGGAFVFDVVGNGVMYSEGPNAMYYNTLLDTTEETARIANYQSSMAWKRAGLRGLPKGGLLTIGPEPWVTSLADNGFTLVSSKISKLMLPEVKQIMLEGFNSGKSAIQIARQINKKAGYGGLHHWKRLVTNEMSIAITDTSLRQYKEQGVGYVKYSASQREREPGEVCEMFATARNGFGVGVYKMRDAPLIPNASHVNCTCVLLPIYRPIGARS